MTIRPFRIVLLVAFVICSFAYITFEIAVYGQKLDRWQEGPFILFALRPIASPACWGSSLL